MNAKILPAQFPAHQTTPRTWSDLPAEIRARLARENVCCAADWRRLKPAERGRLWGITTSMVKLIDAVARTDLGLPASDDSDIAKRRERRKVLRAQREALKARQP